MNQELTTIDQIFGPKNYRVIVNLVNHSIIASSPVIKYEAKQLYDKIQRQKKDNELIIFNDNTLDPHYVAQISIVQDRPVFNPKINNRNVEISIEREKKHIAINTNEKSIQGVMEVITEALIWSILTTLKNRQNDQEINTELQRVCELISNEVKKNIGKSMNQNTL